MERHYFLPLIARHGHTQSERQITQLKIICERWVRQLSLFLVSALAHREAAAEDWLRQVFHPPEERMTAKIQLGLRKTLEIIGQYDALLFDPAAGEAVLVEFKGRKASHADEDFLQLALYAWLLKEGTGISARGVVLYLEEEEPEIAYSAGDLASALPNVPDLVAQVVAVTKATRARDSRPLPPTPDPTLCRSCPYDPSCDRDWGKRQAGAQPHLGAEDPATDEARGRMDALVQTLASLRLPVEPAGFIAGPRFIRLKLMPRLDQGVTVRRLCSQADNLQVALHLAAPPLIQAQPGHVSVDVPRDTRIPLTLGAVWRQGARNRPDSKAAFPIGMAIDGTIVWADLSDSNMTSILVGGTAGSGKSMFLRAAIIGMCLNASPIDIQCLLVDPKRVTFGDLGRLPYLAGPILMDPAPALERLGALVAEMETRYRLFECRQVHDIRGYHGLGEAMAHQVAVIDEYADLMIDKKGREGLETGVVRLAQKGRAAGIHLILATQRPDSKVVTPLIKANLQMKVALKVTTTTNSKVILDESGAECLIGNGDMLIGGAVPIQRLQGPLVTGSEIREVMSKTGGPGDH